MSTRDLFRPDPDIGYLFLPKLRARVAHESGGYLLETNELGFRSASEVKIEKQQVLVFGDSFTAGDGVSNGKRWSDTLAREFDRAEFHNFALPGSGTDQQYLIWRKFARDRQSDLIVIAVLVENIRRIMSAWRPASNEEGQTVFRAKPYFELKDGLLVRGHDPVPIESVTASELGEASVDLGGRFPTLRRMLNRLEVKDLVQSLTGYQPVPDYDHPDTPGWQLMRAILVKWLGEIRTIHDCAVAVVPLPLYQHVEGTADPKAYQARFSELGADLNVHILDPLPALQGYSQLERRGFRFERDVHLTQAGHAAVAEALAPRIRDLLECAS